MVSLIKFLAPIDRIICLTLDSTLAVAPHLFEQSLALLVALVARALLRDHVV